LTRYLEVLRVEALRAAEVADVGALVDEQSGEECQGLPEFDRWSQLQARRAWLDERLERARAREERLDEIEQGRGFGIDLEELPDRAATDPGVAEAAFGATCAVGSNFEDQPVAITQANAITLKTVPTYWARISMGLQEGFDGPVHTVLEVREFLMPLVEKERFCVALTLTATELIYWTGTEPCVEIALMNYPRYPSKPEQVREHALRLAEALLLHFHQYRLTVMFPEETLLVDSGLEPNLEP